MRNIEALAVRELPALLTGWLGTEARAVPSVPGVDLFLESGEHQLACFAKGRDDIPTLERAVVALDRASLPHGALRIVVVPYAGPGARAWLRSHGQSWIDLSGNADITGPGLRILIEGKANRYATAGRPSTVFSPRAARITRVMLLDPARTWAQVELVAATNLSHGFVSKVVRRMIADELLVHASGRVHPRDPAILLDAWAQQYRFREHHLERYQLAARTGPSTLRNLGESLDAAGVEWAATGLAAAWSLTGFADFRLTSLYVRTPLVNPAAHGLHAVARGENVWLLVPRDGGELDGAQRIGGALCVSPAQVYLDLAAHPERSREAAEHLRAKLLHWGRP